VVLVLSVREGVEGFLEPPINSTFLPCQKYIYPNGSGIMSRVFGKHHKPNKVFPLQYTSNLVNRHTDIIAINSNSLLLKRWSDDIKRLVKPG
jgi:hypothetical protein